MSTGAEVKGQTASSVEVIVELRGRDDGGPVPGVFVQLMDVDGAGMSDQSGRAQLSAPPGTYLIRTSHVAYHDVATALVVPSDSTRVTVSFELSFRAIPLPPIMVEAEPILVELDRRLGFYPRAESFDHETIQSLVTTDVLKTLSYRAGFPITCVSEGECGMEYRGQRTGGCLIVDQVEFPGGFEVFRAFPIEEIARVEFYGNAVQVFTRDYFRRVTNPDNVMPVEAVRCRNP